jgi:integrase
MTGRRARGEGGLSWNEDRQRWIASVTVGYDGRGKRVVKRASGRTKTAALRKLREMVRAHEDGLSLGSASATVGQAVEDWLRFGQVKAGDGTREKNGHLCRKHVIPHLGAHKLRDLRAVDVDRWLTGLADSLSTSTLRQIHACLNRSVRRAMARDLVHRNVVELCQVPHGQVGRPSKSMTLEQATSVLTATSTDPLHAYIVVSLLTGARTEELRALRWEDVDLEGDSSARPLIPPHVAVWRSVRANAETKTKTSRRTLALPALAVQTLRTHRARQAELRLHAGVRWQEAGLVFTTAFGTELDAANVRRDFRRALAVVPGLDPSQWTPRELRHSFVSLLSDSAGLPIEEISRLVGHSGTHVTELVYRHQLRPVIQSGATAMDALFGDDDDPGDQGNDGA